MNDEMTKPKNIQLRTVVFEATATPTDITVMLTTVDVLIPVL